MPQFTQPAPFACDPASSRGRLHAEPESRTRTDFQRDRDRVIHSTAFRRLKHKTQVFVAHEGDHYRTRLTHSLEVAQIARSIARSLGLEEDLSEALALAHDLGHPPFGHAGETALDESMNTFGGFDHNAQTLRVVTLLEQRYIGFDGLNLCWETLEGIVKHNGPLLGPHAADAGSIAESILRYCKQHDLELDTFAGAEAQVAALSDDIAYNNHDIDDGLRAGLFSVRDLLDLPLIGDVFRDLRRQHPEVAEARLVHEGVRRLIGIMVDDALQESRRKIGASKPRTASEIRQLGSPIVAFSDSMERYEKILKGFLMQHMYRHPRVAEIMAEAKTIISDLFAAYTEDRRFLPDSWRNAADRLGREVDLARLVADYVAGMTDLFALREHRRVIGGQRAEILWDGIALSHAVRRQP